MVKGLSFNTEKVLRRETKHTGFTVGPGRTWELGSMTPHALKVCFYKICLTGRQVPAHGTSAALRWVSSVYSHGS